MDQINRYINEIIASPNFQARFKETVKATMADPEVQAFLQAHAADIDEQLIENSLSKLHEFVQGNRQYRAGEAGANPGFRPELFLNGNYIDVTYVPTEAYYQEQEQREKRNLLKNEMMSAEVRDASLSSFYLNSPERLNLFNEATTFLEQYLKNPKLARGLYIVGPFGVGKTYMLGAIANYLAQQKKSVTLIHFPTFTNDMKGLIAQNAVHDKLNEVSQSDVLMIDDIGAESNTVWIRDDLLTPLLEYRMKESLPTFFSSNFNFEELKHHLSYTKDNRQEIVKASRILERIRYLAKVVNLNGPNLRQARAEKEG